MTKIVTEQIADRERWLSVEPLTASEIEHGLDCCLKQIDANMEAFGTKFPWCATKGLEYPIIENIEWTDGFWTGLLWLAFEVTGDTKYRDRALENVGSLLHRVENRIELDHHDLGFLYVPSCVAAYRLTGSEDAHRAALLAADKHGALGGEGPVPAGLGSVQQPGALPFYHRLHAQPADSLLCIR